ncbi:hypothetical protein ACLB1G_01715 [Oxalobacteraceae bacterium A2-2]
MNINTTERRRFLRYLAAAIPLPCLAGAPPRPLVGLPDLEPWVLHTPSGVRGPFIELVRALGAASGQVLVPYLAPYARVLSGLEGGSLDAMVAIASERLLRQADEIMVLGPERVLLVLPQGAHPDVLRGATVGQLRWTGLATAELAALGARAYETGSHLQGWRMFQAGRLDAVVIPGTACDCFARHGRLSRPWSAIELRRTAVSLFWSRRSALPEAGAQLRRALQDQDPASLLARARLAARRS